MKILFVIPYYKPAYVYGGPIRSISILSESLVLKNHDVTIFTTNAIGQSNQQEPLNKPVNVDGVIVHYFNRDILNNFYYSRGFSKACTKEIANYDIIYIMGNWTYPFISASRCALKESIPFIVAPHGSFKKQAWRGKEFKKSIYFWLFERSLIQKAAYIHYTTLMEKQDSTWLNLRTPSFVIPNAIDLSEFDHLPERGDFRNKLGIRSDQIVLLSLGRIEPIKGLDIAINSLALLANKYQNMIFVIAGPEEDGYQSKLLKKASSLGISDRIIFTGLLNSHDRLLALRDADIFLNTSHSENFSVSSVEAMAIGLPVIVSDKVGVADDILENHAGLVVPNKPDLIACEIERLINSAELINIFRENSKSLVREKYSPVSVASQFDTLFKNVIVNVSGTNK